MDMNLKPLALYIHVPFCQSKCRYCDFASWSGRSRDWAPYFDALVDEWAGWAPRLAGSRIETIFFGGGTPSLVPAELPAALLARIRKDANVATDAEISLEANPGTLTDEKLRAYRAMGVNRLSMGVQAMDDRLLRALGRIHTAADVRREVDAVRRAGFDNLSLDLMYALPGQTMDDWLRTLREAAALGPDHISAYSLIVEEGTPLAEDVSAGRVSVPGDDEAVEYQRAAIDHLASQGFARYEISNFARPGRACRHNLVYWRRGDYLGLGCAAHSLMDGWRFENPRHIDRYLAGERQSARTEMSERDVRLETIMLATRLTEGIDLAAWQRRFGEDFLARHRASVTRLKDLGLITVEDGRLALTRHGMELQNSVVVELWEDE